MLQTKDTVGLSSVSIDSHFIWATTASTPELSLEISVCSPVKEGLLR
jgi:hypothetical protein